MAPTATANSKRGFSLIEFLVSLFILTLALIALTNAVVFFLHQKVKNTIATRTADVALELVNYQEKLNNCQNVNAWDYLKNSTQCDTSSSIYCKKTNACQDNNTCIICYTNPDSGKAIYYAFNATEISNKTYEVHIYWLFGNYNGTYTTIITLP